MRRELGLLWWEGEWGEGGEKEEEEEADDAMAPRMTLTG